jgi:hypothetical protein
MAARATDAGEAMLDDHASGRVPEVTGGLRPV